MGGSVQWGCAKGFSRNNYRIVLILGYCVAAFSPAIHAQSIPVGTNMILLDNIPFDQAVNALSKRGYAFDTLDKKNRLAVTEFKDVTGTICHLSISIREKSGVTIVTGRWWTNVSRPDKGCGEKCIYPVAWTNFQGLNLIFLEMDHFANSLKGKITYRKN